jgi:hypothetical protein
VTEERSKLINQREFLGRRGKKCKNGERESERMRSIRMPNHVKWDKIGKLTSI